MTVRQVQREVSSFEFSEWLAFYAFEAELQDPDRPPDIETSVSRFHAGVLAHNAALAAKDRKR